MSNQTEARRVVLLLDRAIAGPVASLWTGHLYGSGAAHGGGGAAATNPAATPAASARDLRRTSSGRKIGTRFVLTKTEDALDSVLPTQAEEFLRRKMPACKFTNVSKLRFDMH
jgi:hypothetical protein